MVKEGNTARRGRGRPRKQTHAAPEPCDAPVIELTSSSDEDEPPPRPPPPPPRKYPMKSFANKLPPILAKRSPRPPPPAKAPPVLPSPKEPSPVVKTTKTLSDKETLLSILESNDEDESDNPPAGPKAAGDTSSPPSKDNLLKSIEDQLRYLDRVDDDKPEKNSSARRGSVEIIDEISSALRTMKQRSDNSLKSELSAELRRSRPEKRVSFDTSVASPAKDEAKRKFFGSSRVDEVKSGIRTKVLSPNDIKLPTEVLEAIKKRSNLGTIEKIVEKTDSNQRSKYIVIFNRGGKAAPKPKISIETEIEELLKSLPAKSPPPKKTRLEVKEVPERVHQTLTTTTTVPLSPAPKPALVSSAEPPPPPPLRFTESPLGHEPPLPWDTSKADGFDKYFQVIDKLIEHHDSFESDSEFEVETEQVGELSSNSGGGDTINVRNIAATIAREFPGWSVEAVAGSSAIRLARNTSSARKQVKVDSEYNVSVLVNNSAIPEYEGMYDSFDNIKQLVRVVDQL